MAFSQDRLHNPVRLLPAGPPTPHHAPLSLQPLISTRNAHVTRLYSILIHLLSLESSLDNSRRLLRTWRALAGCKEVHFGVLWKVGTAVIDRIRSSDQDQDDEEDVERRNDRKAAWLKHCQEGKLDKVDKFYEYILALVAANRSQFALDELESYLDNQPYHDSISLNTLSAQLCLLIAQPPSNFLFSPRSRSVVNQPSSTSESSSDSETEQDAQANSGIRRRGSEEGIRSRKRMKKSSAQTQDNSLPGDDLIPYLQSLSSTSPALLSKAKERFKRAVRLETRQREAGEDEDEVAAHNGKTVVRGEAERWLDMLNRAEKIDTRADSPA